jgi:fatty acid/phospholipid biosynthesis enzyme
MNSQISNFKLAFDVMGADNSYDEAIKAAIEMIKLTDNLIIYLVGDKFKIAKILGENN